MCVCHMNKRLLTYLLTYLARSRDKLLQGLSFEINMALCTVFRIRPKIRLRRIFYRSRILAGFRKTAGFRPELEPKSGTALISTQSIRRKSYSYNSARPRDWNETEIKQPKRFTGVLAFVAVFYFNLKCTTAEIKRCFISLVFRFYFNCAGTITSDSVHRLSLKTEPHSSATYFILFWTPGVGKKLICDF